MAISRIYGQDLSEYVQWFRDHADEVESPALRKKLFELSGELGQLDRRLAGRFDEREQWTQRLDELQGALVACHTAEGVGSACTPFYARIDRVISDCASLATTMAEQKTPSVPPEFVNKALAEWSRHREWPRFDEQRR